LTQLLSVDEDISVKFQSIVQDESLMANLNQAATAIQEAIVTKGCKIYIYGCGSTGRLAKQIESETWK
jgi:N-acetylmuramic acid 6-phosphate etherase